MIEVHKVRVRVIVDVAAARDHQSRLLSKITHTNSYKITTQQTTAFNGVFSAMITLTITAPSFSPISTGTSMPLDALARLFGVLRGLMLPAKLEGY
ncbi:MAG TPA: hypothetical protein VLW83_01200 [Candidatus Acidoferrales bacterium]|nr:hypothetical protein [Candidatus Acidoferrales bacterium]